MIRLFVSMVPCLVRKSAISWYACNITCVIDKAYFQQMLEKARPGPSTVFLRLQGILRLPKILRLQGRDSLTTFVWQWIIHYECPMHHTLFAGLSLILFSTHTLHSGEQQCED